MNRHLQESRNMYDSHTNPIILSIRLSACFVCCLCLFISNFFVTAATTKIVNVGEWFESLESFISIISIFLNLWIWMSRRINQTCFECYEFDVNIVLMLNATCTYRSMLNWVRMNQSSWISIFKFKIQIIWVFVSTETIHCFCLADDLLMISV